MFVCKLCKQSSGRHSEGCVGTKRNLCHWCYSGCTAISRVGYVTYRFNCPIIPQVIEKITDNHDWRTVGVIGDQYHQPPVIDYS